MKNKPMREGKPFAKMVSVFGTVVILLALYGCINYEQKTTLHMDGSGTASIHYWADEDVVSFLSDGPLVFDEAKIIQRFAGEGIEMKSVKTEMNEEDSTRHVYVDLTFSDITELANTKAFEDVDITWGPNGDMMKFTQKIKSGEGGGSMGMDEFSITYTYEMPGEIISSNATDHDGNTLTWKYKLSELGGDGVIMSATVKKGSMLADYAVTIAIIGGVILLIVVLFFALRKKPEKPSADEIEIPPVDEPSFDENEARGKTDYDVDEGDREPVS